MVRTVFLVEWCRTVFVFLDDLDLEQSKKQSSEGQDWVG